MAEHTPTPWRHDGRTIYALNEDGENRMFIMAQGGFIRRPPTGDVRTPETEIDANAAFIVKAVNAHQELIDALHGAIVIIGHPDDRVTQALVEILERLK